MTVTPSSPEKSNRTLSDEERGIASSSRANLRRSFDRSHAHRTHRTVHPVLNEHSSLASQFKEGS
jgi:hypothetical protein